MYTPTVPAPKDDTVIENSLARVTFDGASGLVKLIENKEKGLSSTFSQNFYYYKSATDKDGINPSGAYIFRPDGNDAILISAIATLSVITGPVVNEVRQSFGSWLTQSVSLSANENRVEFRYNIGSIPLDDNIGKEVITRYITDVASNKTSYTDSNGREFLQRIKDYRPTWNYQVIEEVAGNYYPVNAATFINDTNKQITILNDRSQGGASINDGQLEIMVHRRTVQDDWRGVGEPMNETQGISAYNDGSQRIGPGLGISGTHYVFLTTPAAAFSTFRPQMDRVYAEPYLTFTSVSSASDWIAGHDTQKSWSATALPVNVHLLTYHAWNDAKTLLVRVAHQFAVNEDATLSAPVTVDLATIVTGLNIANATELSLTANQAKSSMKKSKLNAQDHPSNTNTGVRGAPTRIIRKDGRIQAIVVNLGPMEIKTFALTVQ